MTNTRMNQIIEPLVGLGTRTDVMYTNQEVVDPFEGAAECPGAGCL